MDKKAQLIINGKCDDVMKKLMAKLEIKIPKWESPIIIPKSAHPLIPLEEKPKTNKRKSSVKKELENKKHRQVGGS